MNTFYPKAQIVLLRAISSSVVHIVVFLSLILRYALLILFILWYKQFQRKLYSIIPVTCNLRHVADHSAGGSGEPL